MTQRIWITGPWSVDSDIGSPERSWCRRKAGTGREDEKVGAISRNETKQSSVPFPSITLDFAKEMIKILEVSGKFLGIFPIVHTSYLCLSLIGLFYNSESPGILLLMKVSLVHGNENCVLWKCNCSLSYRPQQWITAFLMTCQYDSQCRIVAWRKAGLGSSLARQLSQRVGSRVIGRPWLKEMRWGVLERDTWHLPLASTCMWTDVHTSGHHPHTPTHTQMPLQLRL